MPVVSAAVVRVLKSRSTMQHTDLFSAISADITVFRCDKKMCVAVSPRASAMCRPVLCGGAHAAATHMTAWKRKRGGDSTYCGTCLVRFRQCMHDLIARGYVRRDDGDHGLYCYVA